MDKKNFLIDDVGKEVLEKEETLDYDTSTEQLIMEIYREECDT